MIQDHVSKSFKSKLFLVFLIGITAIAGSGLLSAVVSLFISGNFISGFFSCIIELLFAIAPCMTAYCAWELYLGQVKKDSIAGIKTYYGFMKVIAIIAVVILAIGGLFATIAILALGTVLANNKEIVDSVIEIYADIEVEGYDINLQDIAREAIEGLKTYAVLIAVACMVIIALAIFAIISFATMCSSIGKYFVRLSDSLDADKIDTSKKGPVVRLWIFGVLSALSALGSLTQSFFSAVSSIGTAAMLIGLALWFDEAHNSYIRCNEEIKAQNEAEFENQSDAERIIIN